MGLLSELLERDGEGFSASSLLDSLRSRKEPDPPAKEPNPSLEWYNGLSPEERARVRWGTSWKPGREVPTGFKHGM